MNSLHKLNKFLVLKIHQRSTDNPIRKSLNKKYKYFINIPFSGNFYLSLILNSEKRIQLVPKVHLNINIHNFSKKFSNEKLDPSEKE